MQAEIQNAVDLLRHLIRTAEEMGIILGEPTDSEQAMQHTRSLVSVHRSPFREPKRQIPIGPESAFVDQDVERAVHRLQIVLLSVDLDGGVHVLPEEIEVAADLPQPAAPDMR